MIEPARPDLGELLECFPCFRTHSTVHVHTERDELEVAFTYSLFVCKLDERDLLLSPEEVSHFRFLSG